MIRKKEKIAFICCTNHKQYQQECEAYIRDLEVPPGYEIEILPIYQAKSMTLGYEEGMHKTDAMYKVYLHQDVFIWNRHFLYDILEVFQKDEKIGMLGVLGGTKIPDDEVLYTCWNEGMTYACDTQDAGIKQGRNPLPGTCQEVEAIDGMLLVTQYDLPWRGDLFDGWDFYDISQSFEFRKKGYKIVVPYQTEPWCMHDCGRTKLQNYNAGRRICLQEYGEFFQDPRYSEADFSYNHALKQSYEELKHSIIDAMQTGNVKQAEQLCSSYDDAEILDTDLSLLKKFVSVCDIEQQLYGSIRTWTPQRSYDEVLECYHTVKFLIWRAERNRKDGPDRLSEGYVQGNFTLPFLIQTGIHNAYHFEKLMPVCLQMCVEKKNAVDLNYLEFITEQISIAPDLDFEKARTQIAAETGTLSADRIETEADIAKVEQICNQVAENRRQYLQEYQGRINQLLQEEKRTELSELLSDALFVERFETDTDMAYMMLSNQIYLEEVREHADRTVFDGHFSIDEVVAYIQEIKFRLWHLEFETEPKAADWLVSFVNENRISGCLLKYIVHIAGMDKIGLLERLAVAFLDHGMRGLAFSMLKYAEELSPGAEDILCTMADLCLQVGKKAEAAECLDKVKVPTEITAAFRKLCEV